MTRTPLDPQPGSYAMGTVVDAPARWLYVSGQVPEDASGVPAEFADQARLAWRNVLSVLEKGGMTVANLVKVTIFLADRRYRAANAEVRQEVLGDHSPALTIIITGIWDESWLLEIEAVAAA
jgi:enamine deaminase RidA (YjgF/YER057c/UK114 family)